MNQQTEKGTPMLQDLLMPHINIILVTVCMLPLYAIGVFLFIIAPCMALSIAFPTIFDRKILKDNWFINVAAFVITIVCGVFLATGLYLSYTFAHDTFTVNEGLNRPLTENFSFTKTSGQIVIEPKHPNVLRGFFQPNNVINITSETDEAYSFIDHGHVYQIPKTIVEVK